MDRSVVGMSVASLDTPTLVIDIDALQRNIAHISGVVRSSGANWRPHTKSHKTPAIAHMQIAAGAIGIACAKLGDAEVMGANGIKDILVPNQIVGPIKTRRVAGLASYTDICVAVDCESNMKELDEAANTLGTRPRVVIEIDTGMNRAGVQPGEPVRRLAEIAANAKALRFAGLMTWEGHAWAMPLGDERTAAIKEACQTMSDNAEMLRAAGIPVDIVSAGGTATYQTTSAMPGITEIQAGGGIFGDAEYIRQGAPVEPAITLRSIVTSRPTPNRVIMDAGRKTVDPTSMAPILRDYQIEGPISFSAEHGIFYLKEACERPAVGEVLNLSIGYSDQCNHLHEQFVVSRNGLVEAIWPIMGRGKIQ